MAQINCPPDSWDQPENGVDTAAAVPGKNVFAREFVPSFGTTAPAATSRPETSSRSRLFSSVDGRWETRTKLFCAAIVQYGLLSPFRQAHHRSYWPLSDELSSEICRYECLLSTRASVKLQRNYTETWQTFSLWEVYKASTWVQQSKKNGKIGFWRLKRFLTLFNRQHVNRASNCCLIILTQSNNRSYKKCILQPWI